MFNIEKNVINFFFVMANFKIATIITALERKKCELRITVFCVFFIPKNNFLNWNTIYK